MDTQAAAILAMSLNFATLIVLALWLFAPWANRVNIVAAIAPLVILHTGRTIALQLFSSQANGYEIPDAIRDQIAWGDQIGFLLAFLAMLALWLRPQLAKLLVWLLVVATVLDLTNALIGGLRHELLGKATDVSWIILTFYVPMLWVSTGLMVWLLLTRRDETWTPLMGKS